MSSKFHRVIPITSSLIIASGLGYYISRLSDTPTVTTSTTHKNAPQFNQNTLPANKPLFRSPRTGRSSTHTESETPPHALKDERILQFENEADYQAFLASLSARGLKLLGQSDRMRAIRVGLRSGSDLSGIDEAEMGYNYLVSPPNPPQAEAQASASGFGRSALSWLGVEGNNSSWGEGVTVAVLDSGVNEHIALQGNITQIDLTELSAGSEQLGHGTAVASIISGDHQLTPGVAPASDILSIRVTDETGNSNSFTLAEGIIQAVDAGADIINISMGSYGDSLAVATAVQYAQDQGSVIVASSGNEGLDTLAYPAAYEGVIAVGAVEQGGNHLDFSNRGTTLDITAPGYQVNAAWGNELLTSFSGTSASAPFVSGAIAATMSENSNMSSTQAADLVLQLSGDAGYPGTDANYGSGILDLGQVMNHGTRGIYDAAVTGQILTTAASPTALPEVWVTVQNQGTETLINSPVSITTASGTKNLNISSLAPGQIQTFNIPVVIPFNGDPVTVSASVQSTEGDSDQSNNSRSDSFAQQE